MLKGLIPEQSPIPPGYCRWATVRLRRVCTGTAITPAVIAFFFQIRHPTATHHRDEYRNQQDGTCRHCQTGGGATCEHLRSNCERLQAHRAVALETLALMQRPANHPEWFPPRGTPIHRKSTLDSLSNDFHFSYIKLSFFKIPGDWSLFPRNFHLGEHLQK